MSVTTQTAGARSEPDAPTTPSVADEDDDEGSFSGRTADYLCEATGTDRAVAEARSEALLDSLPLVREAQIIGGALITVVIVGIVLNQFFQTDIVNTSTGPFAGVFSSAESIGVAGLTILVVGVLVVAGNAVMGYFGGGFK